MTGNRSAGDERSVAEKVFAIADAFGTGTELSLSDIAQRANLPLSTAHRLLAEWVEWGGIVRGDDGLYRGRDAAVEARRSCTDSAADADGRTPVPRGAARGHARERAPRDP